MNLQEVLDLKDKGGLTIPENYLKLLDNLDDAEGDILHRNDKELDITNGWGIYRKRHPKAMLWEYIDARAKLVTNEPSNEWDDDEIELVISQIDPEVEKYLTYLFYKDYFKGAHLELFHIDNVILMANLYTNSQKGAWMSVQEGVWDMYKYGFINVKKRQISGVDGDYGRKTRNCLNLIKELDWKEQIIFKQAVLLAMKSYYTDLTTGNPDKFLGYGQGWDNRMEELQHSD
jgi:hypothetical protein